MKSEEEMRSDFYTALDSFFGKHPEYKRPAVSMGFLPTVDGCEIQAVSHHLRIPGF